MATMNDVARIAGVSQSTVSHYINGTRPVRPDTAAAIQRAIEETGYLHDAVASSLRTGKSNTIGLAMSAISNPYFGALVRHIEERVTQTGRTVLLVDTRDEVDRELAAVEQLLRHRPDAVLLAPAGPTSRALDLLVHRRVPTVLVDRVLPEMPERVDAAGVSNRGPMRDLVSHLGELGHRAIALLAPLAGIPTTTERVEGFLDGLGELGQDPRTRVAYATTDPDETAAAMDLLFSADPGPTAVIGGNNQSSIAALRWLRDHGLDVPADVSLASYDDFEWSDLFHPRLTTISQPIEALAEASASLLEARMTTPDAPGRIVRLEPELIVRDSVAPITPAG